MLNLTYDGKNYKIFNETANVYRIVDFVENVEIYFTAEWKGGSYFDIKSVSYGGRTYKAQRYDYKFVPLVREATFEIYKTMGLYDYTNKEFRYYEETEKNA